jgi:TPR repeat protein
LYAEGQGVTQDNVSAYLWFSLAAAQGDKGAINNLDRVARHMSQAQILEAKKLVSEWQPKKSQTD